MVSVGNSYRGLLCITVYINMHLQRKSRIIVHGLILETTEHH